MSAPKHKKNLKWKIAECRTCNRVMKESSIHYGCKKQGHAIVPVPNEPFAVENLTFVGFSSRYRAATTATVQDPGKNRKHTMSVVCFEDVVPYLEKGVLKGKHWFVWSRRLSRMSIEYIGPDQ